MTVTSNLWRRPPLLYHRGSLCVAINDSVFILKFKQVTPIIAESVLTWRLENSRTPTTAIRKWNKQRKFQEVWYCCAISQLAKLCRLSEMQFLLFYDTSSLLTVEDWYRYSTVELQNWTETECVRSYTRLDTFGGPLPHQTLNNWPKYGYLGATDADKTQLKYGPFTKVPDFMFTAFLQFVWLWKRYSTGKCYKNYSVDE